MVEREDPKRRKKVLLSGVSSFGAHHQIVM
jgi:hypothetical protein